MIKKISQMLTALVVAVGIGVAAVPVAYAGDCTDAASCMQQGTDKANGGATNQTVQDLMKTITNVLLFIIGAVAVIMIVVGGLKYMTSNGDSSSIASAKNTILYAVIGLIVAIMAYAIVNFVIAQFTAAPKK